MSKRVHSERAASGVVVKTNISLDNRLLPAGQPRNPTAGIRQKEAILCELAAEPTLRAFRAVMCCLADLAPVMSRSPPLFVCRNAKLGRRSLLNQLLGQPVLPCAANLARFPGSDSDDRLSCEIKIDFLSEDECCAAVLQTISMNC